MYKVIMAYIALFCFVMFVLAGLANAMQDNYGTNQCELIAKDFQKEAGGSLVWIQPLKSNGAYDLGGYKAHIINKIYISDFEGVGATVYFDYSDGSVHMYSKDDVKRWYENLWGKKVEVFDLSEERPPFSMIWHY